MLLFWLLPSLLVFLSGKLKFIVMVINPFHWNSLSSKVVVVNISRNWHWVFLLSRDEPMFWGIVHLGIRCHEFVPRLCWINQTAYVALMLITRVRQDWLRAIVVIKSRRTNRSTLPDPLLSLQLVPQEFKTFLCLWHPKQNNFIWVKMKTWPKDQLRCNRWQ